MNKAIIFDLDGVITDSEPLQFRAHQKMLAGFGIRITRKDYLKYGVGAGPKALYETVAHRDNKKINIEEAKRIKHDITEKEIMPRLIPRPGFESLLKRVYGRYRLAVASAGQRRTVFLFLAKLGLEKYFETVVTGSEVKENKPSPEIYLKTAAKLGLEPSRCLVIEDSEKGVAAANRAGMTCIAAPTDFTRQQDFSRADRVAESLDEIDAALLNELI